MPEFNNMDEAASALAASVNGSDESTAVQPNQVAPDSLTQGDQGDQSTEFAPAKNIDLSGLPQEGRDYILAREREMQADYTQKMQDLSAQRQEAEQAQQFIEQLNSNPFFAQQVVQEISAQLQQSGFSPAQAEQMAQAQVGGGTPQAPDAPVDDFGDDPYFKELQRLEAQQNQLQSTFEAQEQRMRESQLEAQLDHMASRIQAANPDFKDDDMARIFNLSYAHGGDLFKAADDYKAVRQSAIESYLAQKASVPAGLNQPNASGHAQIPPQGFTGIDDPNLEAAAQRMLSEALGQ